MTLFCNFSKRFCCCKFAPLLEKAQVLIGATIEIAYYDHLGTNKKTRVYHGFSSVAHYSLHEPH